MLLDLFDELPEDLLTAEERLLELEDRFTVADDREELRLRFMLELLLLFDPELRLTEPDDLLRELEDLFTVPDDLFELLLRFTFEPLFLFDPELLFTVPDDLFLLLLEPTLLLEVEDDRLLLVTLEDLTLDVLLVLESILLPVLVSPEELLFRNEDLFPLSYFCVKPLLLGPYAWFLLLLFLRVL